MFFIKHSYKIPREGEPDPEPDSKPEKTFTQEEVNAFLAKDKKTFQFKIKSQLDEINALKEKQSLTSQERKELEAKIEQLEKDLMTKEQLEKEKLEKVKNEREEELQTANKAKEIWKNQYIEEKVRREISDAAIENDAYHPEQIVAILQSRTEIIGDLEKDKKLDIKIKLTEKDEENKDVELILSPSDAVKRMSETDKYLNLFKGKGVGGVGGTNETGADPGEIDWSKMSVEKYKKIRDELKKKEEQYGS